MTKKIFFLLFIILGFVGFSQTPQLSEQAEISFLNCGEGNQSYSLYGHTAIRVKDVAQNIDLVFNYGTFDFDTSNFILKFIKGDLQYFVSAYPYANFEYSYQLEKRSIWEQKLKLNAQQKQDLFATIWNSLQTDDKYYTYKFIDKNCTTISIDKVNDVLTSSKIESIKPITKTYREILFPYQEKHFFLNLGINLIFGTKVDEAAEKLFLPLDLIASLEQNETVAEPKVTLYKAPENSFNPSIFDSIFTLIIILGIIILSRKKWLPNSYFFLLGIVGLFFCLVGLYSLHQEILWNYNALLVNPFYLVLLYFLIKKNGKAIRTTAKLLFVFHLIYLVYMLNKVHLTIVSPILVANFILLARILMQTKLAKQAKIIEV